MIMTSEEKSLLRKEAKTAISSLTDEYITISNKGIYERVISSAQFIDAKKIMIYYSIDREPATHDIAKIALDMGKTVAFPLCYSMGIMDARIVSNLADFSTSVSVIGIPSPPETSPIIPPEELDLILVPALAYDLNGYRLGLGGGYFDRFLQGLPAYTIGLARERLIRDILPTEPHDVPVNCIVTEEKVRILN